MRNTPIRRTAALVLGGVLPVAYNGVAMLTNYISPEQRFIAARTRMSSTVSAP